jgi:hypothetical protein
MQKIGILLGALTVLLIGAAVTIVILTPGGFGSLVGNFGPEQREEIADTFEITNGNIIVNNDNGKVEVIGVANATRVSVTAIKIAHGDSRDVLSRLNYTAKLEGTNVIITGGKGSGWMNWGNDRVEITIAAPVNMVADIQTSNGSVKMTNFENSLAAYSLRTSNGSITVDQLKANMLRLSSSNGSLNMRNVVATLNAHTSNGKVEAYNSELNVERIDTSNGSVELNGKINQTGNGTISTSNGSVNLRVEKTSDFVFDVNTGNGSINYQLGGAALAINEKHHLKTAGNGPTLRISTGNGSVTLR